MSDLILPGQPRKGRRVLLDAGGRTLSETLQCTTARFVRLDADGNPTGTSVEIPAASMTIRGAEALNEPCTQADALPVLERREVTITFCDPWLTARVWRRR